MEIAPEAGVSVVEQALRPEDLHSADEVFISSTKSQSHQRGVRSPALRFPPPAPSASAY